MRQDAPIQANDDLTDALGALVARILSGARLENLSRVSGGASQQTWAFDAVKNGETRPLILRRAPPGYAAPFRAAGLPAEAALMSLALQGGVPSPRVVHVLRTEDGIGVGFIMHRVAGETIARKIFTGSEFADIRPKLTRQIGEILARIHAIDVTTAPKLRTVAPQAELAELRKAYEDDGQPRPVFELAFRWLEANAPPPLPTVSLVHGDFRNGNIMIAPDGVSAVLDWELAHLGDPMEDIGWLCVNCWRFGNIGNRAGGFGSLNELIEGYEKAGGVRCDRARIDYWETLGTLRWGVMCLGMLARFARGEDRTPERALIARRASETEIDLLRLLAPRK